MSQTPIDASRFLPNDYTIVQRANTSQSSYVRAIKAQWTQGRPYVHVLDYTTVRHSDGTWNTRSDAMAFGEETVGLIAGTMAHMLRREPDGQGEGQELPAEAHSDTDAGEGGEDSGADAAGRDDERGGKVDAGAVSSDR